MNTQTKQGRGRPKGSYSFVAVTLEELNQRFSPKQTIQIGRVWLEQQTLPPSQTSPPNQFDVNLVADEPVEMTLVP